MADKNANQAPANGPDPAFRARMKQKVKEWVDQLGPKADQQTFRCACGKHLFTPRQMQAEVNERSEDGEAFLLALWEIEQKSQGGSGGQSPAGPDPVD